MRSDPHDIASPVLVHARRAAGAVTLALGALLAGCATGYVTIPDASPEQIPALEARAATEPDDVGTLTHLGAAYREAGRPAEAREVLEQAHELAPVEPLPVVLLGLTYEDLEGFTAARELYEEYLRLVPDTRLRARIEGRMELMRRRELEALVADALAQESDLEASPAPTTIAVFPFRFQGSDPELEPLGHAIAGLVSTDLSQIARLTVLDRMHIEALIREVELGETDLVNPATAARSGRLVGAGRIVQGRLGGGSETLELDAAVVRVAGADPDVSPVRRENTLEQVFAMQKDLVLGIVSAMGVTLTAAERERVMQRRTDNLQALLAYGEGLAARQRGDYQQAAEHFRRAADMDSDFGAAETESQQTENMASAEAEVGADFVGDAVQDVETPQVTEAVDVVETAAVRDAPQEALGTEGARPTVILEIILRRPGGGQ